MFGIAGDNVSGRHARITLTPSGAFLTDLDSTNGTFLNDRRVVAQMPLRQGDFIRLGQTGPGFQVAELDLVDAPTASAGATACKPAATRMESPRAQVMAGPAPMRKPAPAAEPRDKWRPGAAKPGVSTTRKMLQVMDARGHKMWLVVGAAVATSLIMLAVLIVILSCGHGGKLTEDGDRADNSDLKKEAKKPVEPDEQKKRPLRRRKPRKRRNQ